MNLKLKGTITLNNDEVCIMLDHKDEIVDKINCQCDDHQPCFPHSKKFAKVVTTTSMSSERNSKGKHKTREIEEIGITMSEMVILMMVKCITTTTKPMTLGKTNHETPTNIGWGFLIYKYFLFLSVQRIASDHFVFFAHFPIHLIVDRVP